MSTTTTPTPRTRRAATSEAIRFDLGERVRWSDRAEPYRRRPGDPSHRRLHVFTLDPATSRFDGAVSEVRVPYEPLAPGPRGALFDVVDRDDSVKADDGSPALYRPADLDQQHLLITSGFEPSTIEWRSHQQMVYAVAMRLYEAFRCALGRDPSWAFDGKRLRLRPHAEQDANAWYDRDEREVAFGYFRREASKGPDGVVAPREWIFTCLSHDVVAHELSHALLDGMRAQFFEPTGPDVLGFHEGFSDIVALLHRFTHRDVVRGALAKVRGDLTKQSALSMLASQFGEALGLGTALRHAMAGDRVDEEEKKTKKYRRGMEEHDMGEVLLEAVFGAFERVYRRKTAQLARLATGGTAELAPGELPHDLVDALTEEVYQLARQFLNVCIRAIDYCPPVDIELGEFLRALITADHDLVPADPWGYREALIQAFRCRGIYPTGVATLSEESLRWRPPRLDVPIIKGLEFGSLRFNDDPGRPASHEEILRQARVLGAYVCDPEQLESFCLEVPGKHARGVEIGRPVVESIRTARRVAPDGSIAFDLVGEVLQTAVVKVRVKKRVRRVQLHGGATVIIGADGAVRYVIAKRATKKERIDRQLDYIRREVESSRGIWNVDRDGVIRPARLMLRAVHRSRPPH